MFIFKNTVVAYHNLFDVVHIIVVVVVVGCKAEQTENNKLV